MLAPPEESDIERLLRAWPRAQQDLARDAHYFLQWDGILRRIERELRAGVSVAKAMLADPRLRRMPRAHRKQLLKLLKADLRDAHHGPSFLGELCQARLFPPEDEMFPAAGGPLVVPLFNEADIPPRFQLARHDFICYRRRSTRDFALGFAAQLTEAGREVWIADRDATPGLDWNDQCREAIVGCGEFIMLLSVDAHLSRRMRGEVQLAIEQGKRVSVLHLAPSLSTDCFDLGLRGDHQLDNWYADPSAGFVSLITALRD